MMGSVAEAIADAIVLTDDNPRNEDGSLIIEEILSGIGDRGMVFVERDRARAVRHAFTHAVENDVVLIAGKGHETTQQIGGEAVPFSDRDVVVELIGEATP